MKQFIKAPERFFSRVLFLYITRSIKFTIFSCLFLHLPSGVGVGAKSEASVIVPQHRRDCFHVHSILQCHGSEGIPQVVKPDMFQPRVLQDLLMEFDDGVRMVHLSRLG